MRRDLIVAGSVVMIMIVCVSLFHQMTLEIAGYIVHGSWSMAHDIIRALSTAR